MPNGSYFFSKFSTVLEFATIFWYVSIGRRRAPEAREARHASILLLLISTPLALLVSKKGDRGCKRALRCEIMNCESSWGRPKEPTRRSSDLGKQRAA